MRPRQSVGVKYGIYAAHFTHGDRHACARDDRLFYCLCERSEANSREGGLLQSMYFIT